MNKHISKTVSRVLALLFVAAMLLGCLPAYAEPVSDVSIQDGVTLHCWNWSFKNIEEKLDIIAALGYTTIQTSPIQQAKQATAETFPTNDWWVFYQPAAFHIDDSGNSALGTKAEFESLCKAAHERGIKVVVDVVANHMGNLEGGGNGIAASVIEDLRKDPDCWHDVKKNTNDYNSRVEVTQYCMAGLPDLNTSNKKVQEYVLNYLKECIDAGADGFRFDAIKHIETPEDGNIASDFWPTVVDGAKDYAKSTRNFDLYCYGELLDSVGGGMGPEVYTKYMSVTDNNWSANLLTNVVGKGIVDSYTSGYNKGAANQMVLWAESHDTYADGTTTDVSEENINKAWALIAARSDAMSLYLARPANFSQLLGAASNTGWAYPEVAAVNKFHTAFAGQAETVSTENGIAYVERGDAGAVLVNCKGTEGDVTVSAKAMKDGTYTDQISGNTFTVADGKISGTFGSTGIAVVYEGTPCAHSEHNAEGFCTGCNANVGHEYDQSNTCSCGDVKVGERTIYFVTPGNWVDVNFYAWYDAINIFTETWPGNPMTKLNDTTYSCTVPEDIPNIIFNNGNGIQTDDLEVPPMSEGKDQFDYVSLTWSTYTGEEGGEAPTEAPDEEVTETPTTDNKDETRSGNSNMLGLWIALGCVGVVAVAIVIALVTGKKK